MFFSKEQRAQDRTRTGASDEQYDSEILKFEFHVLSESRWEAIAFLI